MDKNLLEITKCSVDFCSLGGWCFLHESEAFIPL